MLVRTNLFKCEEKASPHILHKKNCCDLNLGESLWLCIVTFLLFSDSGLHGFDIYIDLFWMAWHWNKLDDCKQVTYQQSSRLQTAGLPGDCRPGIKCRHVGIRQTPDCKPGTKRGPRASSYEPGRLGWLGFRNLSSPLFPPLKFRCVRVRSRFGPVHRDLGFCDRDLGMKIFPVIWTLQPG